MPRLGSRQDVRALALDHQSGRKNNRGSGIKKKPPWSEGRIGAKPASVEDSVWLHRKNTNEHENGSVQNCTLPSGDSSPHHRRAAINFRLGVLRPPDNICDFMSMYLSNSGQTTVINIAQKFIWLPCKFAFSRKWRPRYGPEPRNVRLANNR